MLPNEVKRVVERVESLSTRLPKMYVGTTPPEHKMMLAPLIYAQRDRGPISDRSQRSASVYPLRCQIGCQQWASLAISADS